MRERERTGVCIQKSNKQKNGGELKQHICFYSTISVNLMCVQKTPNGVEY